MKEGGIFSIDVAVGDTVMYAKYVGEEIIHNGETYMVVRNDSLLAKIIK